MGLFEDDEEWGKTRTIKDTIDPVFDHKFEIPLLDVMPLGGKLKPFRLQMFDVDDGLFDNTDDALGQVTLDWQQLFPNANGQKKARGEYTLDVGKIKNEKARGTALVKTTCEPRFDAKFFKKSKRNQAEDEEKEVELDEKGRPPPPKARMKRGKPPPPRPKQAAGDGASANKAPLPSPSGKKTAPPRAPPRGGGGRRHRRKGDGPMRGVLDVRTATPGGNRR